MPRWVHRGYTAAGLTMPGGYFDEVDQLVSSDVVTFHYHTDRRLK